MNLHFDYITKQFPDRCEMVNALAKAVADHGVTLEDIGHTLSEQGMFPAASITLALMALHKHQGQQTFVVGEHLAEMLEHTKLDDVPRDELRLPYPVFYVALPGCTHRVWGGSRTKWHRVAGLYVQLSPRALTVMAWAGDNEHSLYRGDDAHIWARLDMDRDEDLETSVYHLLRDRKSENNDPIIDPLAIIEGSQDDGITDEVRAVQTETLTAMFRLAVNLSLYLTSRDPETEAVPEDQHTKALRGKLTRAKNPGKRKKIERQLARHSTATVIRVGLSIEEKVRAQVAEHGSVSAHWVRGHWHHYWTGTGRTVKVRRWVLPYPKGLEPPTKRSYKVEDAEQGAEQDTEQPSTEPATPPDNGGSP